MIKLHKKYISISFIFQIIFISLNNMNFIKSDCPKDSPIKINGECKSKFCTESDFKSEICSIENEIIKTQWLNNFIIFDEYRYRFSNMAINKKEDLIFETSSEELNGVRLFFGLKKNGRYYFKNNNNEKIPTKKIIVLDDKNEGAMRYESNLFFIKIKNGKFEENKEFLVSISLFYGFIELFDLEEENNPISTIPAVDFNNYVIYAKVCSIIELNNKEYLYIFNGKPKDGWDDFIVIKKYIFYDINLNSDNTQNIPTKVIRAAFSRNANAFKTDSNQIILFYVNIENKYKIEALNEKLETMYEKYFKQIPSSCHMGNEYFNKCIHLRDNIGIFIYYLNHDDNSFPFISIEDIDIKTGFNTLFNFNLEEITDEYQFNGYPHLNDLVKINNKRFSYLSPSNDKRILYIILFDLYNNKENINIRYYKIRLYDFYHFKIYSDISSIAYNNFLAITMSVCNSLQCDNKTDSFFTSLLFFSYYNSSDFKINITSYFSNFENDENNDNDNITIPFPNNIKIDNNIFGYQISEKIKIISIPNEIKLYLINENKEKTEIKVDDEINPNNINLTISPKHDTIKNNNTYFIEYQYKYTDPDYDTFNNYPDKIVSYPENSTIDDQREEFNNDIKIHFSKSLKIEFKLCNENCKTCKIIGKSNNLTRCEECFEKWHFFYDERTKSKTCFPECSKEYPFMILGESVKCSDVCDYDDIKNGKCFLDNTDIESLKLVYSLLSNIISNEYNNEDAILKSDEGISFHLTNTLNEKEKLYKEKNNYYNLSIIDLGNCESKLKERNGIPGNISLIFLKFESYYENSAIKNVQYEIYNPITRQKISDLSPCQNDIIDIYIPTNLDNETLIIYEDLKNQGYDIYNPNDTFYNDICTKYTSINNTDLTLNDRKSIFYDNQIFCQENCQYNGINLDIMHAKCECSLSTTEIEYESKKFSGIEIVTSFYDVIKYSNFLILKCYKLLFSSIGIKNNYGFIIMVSFASLLIIFTIIFLFTGMKIIREQMSNMIYCTIHKLNHDASSEQKNNNINIAKYSEFPSMPIKKKVKKKKKIIKIVKRKRNIDFQNINNLEQTKCSKTTFVQNESSQSKVNNPYNSNTKIVDLNSNIALSQKNYEDHIYFQRKITKKKSSSLYDLKMPKLDEIDITENINKYSEFELDDLDYSVALEYDKRTLLYFFWCLVKREHLIVFTFIYCKDFNLISIKLSLFVFSVCLDMTTNLLFFNDDSMHKIYLDYGKYDFISQIPQIIYSTIISETMDVFLKYLSLSEKEIYETKKHNNPKDAIEAVKKLIRCLKIKFFFFFFIFFIFMIFSWYFISIFCAIYENTQFILFKDCAFSLLISLLYPFPLYFIPAILRIISLRSEKKDKECMYKISNIFPLF